MQLKIFKTKKSFKKGGLHTDPEVYWVLSLCLAFAIIISSFILAFSMFQNINKDIASSNNNSASTQLINKDRVKKILDYFSTRKKKAVQILNSPAPVVDPSL